MTRAKGWGERPDQSRRSQPHIPANLGACCCGVRSRSRRLRILGGQHLGDFLLRERQPALPHRILRIDVDEALGNS